MLVEIEMKLAITNEEAEKLQDCQFIKKLAITEKPKIKQIKTDYYDTPALNLAKHGVALRIRQQGDKFYQTLKTAGEAKQGLHQRQEWEHEIKNSTIDLNLLPEQYAESLKAFIDKLQPIFTTEFKRTAWILKVGQQTEVELVLDQGLIKAANHQQAISEVEIELKQGDQQDLLAVAAELQTELVVEPFDESKAERGYKLYQQSLKN